MNREDITAAVKGGMLISFIAVLAWYMISRLT
jgi:hypothetical protein